MKCLKPSLLCLGLFVSCMLVGCVYVPQPQEMIGRNLQQASTFHDSVIVSVEGGQKTTAWTSPGLISNEDFSAALIESLRKSGLFKSVGTSGAAAFRLDDTLVDLAQPLRGGADAKVNLEVDWRLIRVSDNNVLWHERIHSTSTRSVVNAFGQRDVKRLLIATEEAARLNIEQGIAKLVGVKF